MYAEPRKGVMVAVGKYCDALNVLLVGAAASVYFLGYPYIGLSVIRYISYNTSYDIVMH